MSDNKKYYYLKLKENFFDSEEIKILESMENGYKYSNILLKMYLRSLKRDGLLMFKETIPYDLKMISTITGHNINDVKQALVLFQQMGLIEVLSNGAIYMMDIQNFIGESSTEADRIRAYRNKVQEKKEKLLDAENTGSVSDITNVVSDDVTNVQHKNDISAPELELEIELEKERSSENNSDTKSSGDEFSATKKENGHYDYPEEFERIYNLYPYQRGNKLAGWRKWAATRRRGVSEEDLIQAVKAYAAKCKREGTEKQWVMHIKKFFGPDRYYETYLNKNDGPVAEDKEKDRLEKIRKEQERRAAKHG